MFGSAFSCCKFDPAFKEFCWEPNLTELFQHYICTQMYYLSSNSTNGAGHASPSLSEITFKSLSALRTKMKLKTPFWKWGLISPIETRRFNACHVSGTWQRTHPNLGVSEIQAPTNVSASAHGKTYPCTQTGQNVSGTPSRKLPYLRCSLIPWGDKFSFSMLFVCSFLPIHVNRELPLYWDAETFYSVAYLRKPQPHDSMCMCCGECKSDGR